MRIYITYGMGTNLKNCYSVVEAPTYAEARQLAHAATGGMFAFAYTEAAFKRQIERWPLKEVDLQPMVYD